MIQTCLKTVDVVGVVFPFLVDGSLRTLPVHSSLSVNPADLICFECYESSDEVRPVEYAYAIAESVVRRSISQPGVGRRCFDLVKFRVVRDLSDIVIS